MTLPRLLRAALVGAVGACVALSGCTPDAPAPTPTPSTSTTDAPTPEPTEEPTAVAAPEKPTLMDSNDAIGARAAAEYFLSLYGYVFQTGDLTEWDAMCHPESEFCNSVRADVVDDFAKGYVQVGGDLVITVEQVEEPTAELPFFGVSGQVSQSAFEVHDAAGNLSDSGEVQSGDAVSVLLSFSDAGTWTIRAVIIGGGS